MSASRFRRSAIAVAALLVTPVLAGEAQAAHVGCGEVITTSTVLDSNIGPCPGNGIEIGASNITLNLNGRTITGDNPANTPGGGEDLGVVIGGFSRVVIKGPGTIRFFDGGVAIFGGNHNRVSGISAKHNQSTGEGDFGHGIALFGSTQNDISDNVITENGPFSGVSLIFDAARENSVRKNLISNNEVGRMEGGQPVQETAGIRLESAGSNRLLQNTITLNGLDGIAAFSGSSDNQIRDNVLERNGEHELSNRLGDGIHLFGGGDRTILEGNRVFKNAANGIQIDSTSNEIVRNLTGDNGAFADAKGLGPSFDLIDTNNPDCDANIWRDNTFDAAVPACTTTQNNRTFYATDDKGNLLSFKQKTPGVITTKKLTGLPAGVSILGIDIRPANGQLYGVGSDSRIYAINPATGATAPQSTGPFTPRLRGSWFGFDFNPVVDRIRIVSDQNQNLRVDPDTGQVVAVDTDMNPGDPFVTGAAYSASSLGAAPTTNLYAMDALQDAIAEFFPPNAGTLRPFRYLGKNVLSVAGFDIAGSYPTGGDVGFIATRTGAGGARLLRVNLTTGSNVDIGRIGPSTMVVTGLAAQQDGP